MGSYYTAADTLIMKNVEMDNIQCYACSKEPINTSGIKVDFNEFIMKNINTVSFNSLDPACTTTNKCKQTASFFYMYINNPTSGTAGN
jgi:hypothetical protein